MGFTPIVQLSFSHSKKSGQLLLSLCRAGRGTKVKKSLLPRQYRDSWQLWESSVTGEWFYDFLRGSLQLPFNRVNSQSIAVMDNCAIHYVQEVKQLFRDSGILLFFFTPYSPDLNPIIKEAYTYVKTYLHNHDELLQSLTKHNHVVESAFDSITGLQIVVTTKVYCIHLAARCSSCNNCLHKYSS